ncbi:hypothetical protein [Acidithiobacillus thiooxidans]|uniref:hypothetical protein n=1 Tax=Acidithiobacillus thiooxidans TaxID=930 RepID=UPI0004E2068E|nr:hypothetical protein [Acidithiobacillus thiooxidans]
MSRRLSDLYNTSDQLVREQRKSHTGGRKQYAYAYKEAGARPAVAATSRSDEGVPEGVKRMQAMMGLTDETPATAPQTTAPQREPVQSSKASAPAATKKAPPVVRTPRPAAAERPATAGKARPEAAKPAATPQPPVAPRSVVPPVHPVANYAPVPEESEWPEVLSDLFTDMFSDMIVRMIEQVGPAIREALFSAPQTRIVKEALRRVLTPETFPTEESEEESAAPSQEESVARRKVLVVGLLGQQANVLKEQFGKHLDLSFWNEDRVNDRLQGLLDSNQTVFGATKFISHAIDGVLTRSPDYRRVHGGVSKLRGELRALLKEEMATA